MTDIAIAEGGPLVVIEQTAVERRAQLVLSSSSSAQRAARVDDDDDDGATAPDATRGRRFNVTALRVGAAMAPTSLAMV